MWFDADLPGDALYVVHRAYPVPIVARRHVPFHIFEKNPRRWLADAPALVMVGLNKAMTPSSRTREVWEILYNNTAELPKFSVDRTLFISEPWRAWFHFGFVGASYREYTYSYLAESHWKAHRDGVREADPFSLDEIRAWGAGVVVSDHRAYFGEVEVETVLTTPDVKAAYAEEKAAAFEEERTLPAILRRLSAVAKAACLSRCIPTPARIFTSPSLHIVRTDLAVDGFLVDNLLRLVDLTNNIAEAFHAG